MDDQRPIDEAGTPGTVGYEIDAEGFVVVSAASPAPPMAPAVETAIS